MCREMYRYIELDGLCRKDNCPMVLMVKHSNTYPITDCCWHLNHNCIHHNGALCKHCTVGGGHGPDLHSTYCWECWNGKENHFTPKPVCEECGKEFDKWVTLEGEWISSQCQMCFRNKPQLDI